MKKSELESLLKRIFSIDDENELNRMHSLFSVSDAHPKIKDIVLEAIASRINRNALLEIAMIKEGEIDEEVA